MSGISDAIHIVLAVACFTAGFRVVPSFQAVIWLNPLTAISGIAFFVLTGVTELGRVIHHDSHWFFLLASYFQAVSIITFLVMLARDLQQALTRLRLAFMAVRHHYGTDGDRVIATVTTALQGGDGTNDRVRT